MRVDREQRHLGLAGDDIVDDGPANAADPVRGTDHDDTTRPEQRLRQ
jgi:hypothetical protein